MIMWWYSNFIEWYVLFIILMSIKAFATSPLPKNIMASSQRLPSYFSEGLNIKASIAPSLDYFFLSNCFVQIKQRLDADYSIFLHKSFSYRVSREFYLMLFLYASVRCVSRTWGNILVCATCHAQSPHTRHHPYSVCSRANCSALAVMSLVLYST